MAVGGRRIAPDIKKVYDELGQPQPASECFGCTHGRMDSTSVAYEPLKTMENMFNNKLEITEAIELARIMKNYFDKSVRDPANANRRDGEAEIPEWRAATIYFHYRHHIMDFSIRRCSRLNMIDQLIMHQYTNCCWRTEIVDGNEVPVPDEKGVKLLEKLVKLEAQAFGQNPRTAMFSFSGIGTTHDEVRPFINTGKKRFYTQSGARFAGRSINALAANAGVGSTVQGTSRGKATASM